MATKKNTEKNGTKKKEVLIDPLYQKYTKSVIRALGSTDFYEFFMDAISRAENQFQFSNRKMEKTVDLDWVDAIEVFNACNHENENFRALYYASAHQKGYTSGGDIHDAEDERIGLAGIVFNNPITNGEELVAALRNGEGTILCGGKPCVK